MTANPARRRASTMRGAIVAGVLAVVAIVASVVAVATLRTSEAGEAVEVDDRTRVEFPSTPVAAIAVVDADDRLTSVALATLDPAGTGGSVVTVPANFDTSLGLAQLRAPLSARPVVAEDPANVDAFVTDLESALRLTIPFSVVMSNDDIEAYVDRFAPIRVDLPEDVVDSAGDGSPEIASAGAQDVDAAEFAQLLTAIDVAGSAYDHHPTDVALWSGLAAAITEAPLPLDLPLDDFDRPIDPVDGPELLERLAAGPVAVRDLAIDAVGAAELPNPDGADFVQLDQFDAVLVFAQIAPGLMSTPNESLTFQIIAPFSDDQVADALGPDVTTELIIRQLISELIFAEGNVVSVQTTPSAEGAGTTTTLDVSDAQFIEAVEQVAPILFGEVEVVEAASLLDGVDVIAVLGTDFLVRRAEILAGEGPTTIADDDAESISDLAEQDDESDGGDEESDGGEDDAAVSDDASESVSDDDASSDTVVVDE